MSLTCDNCSKYEDLKAQFDFIKSEYDIVLKEHTYYEKLIFDAFEKNNLLPINKDNFTDGNSDKGTASTKPDNTEGDDKKV